MPRLFLLPLSGAAASQDSRSLHDWRGAFYYENKVDMAKRFTETKIWDDIWFQELPAEWKLLWKYICDKCDEAGIWKTNFKLANFQINEKIEWTEAPKWLNNGKIRVQFEDSCWIILDFVEFQYGDKINKSTHPFHEKIRNKIATIKSKTTNQNMRKKLKPERQKIFSRDEYTCQWCSEKKQDEELIIDHFIPLTLDGDNSEENLLTSCRRCNTYKWMFSPIEFLEKRHNFINLTQKLKEKIDTLSKIGYQRYPINDRVKEEEEVKEKEKEKEKEKVMEKQEEASKELRNGEITVKEPLFKNNTKEIQDYFYRRFKETFNKEYIANFGKDGKIFKDLSVKIPPEELKRLVDAYFSIPDKFVEEGGYSVGIFKSRINSLRIEKKTHLVSEKGLKSAQALTSWLKKKGVNDGVR